MSVSGIGIFARSFPRSSPAGVADAVRRSGFTLVQFNARGPAPLGQGQLDHDLIIAQAQQLVPHQATFAQAVSASEFGVLATDCGPLPGPLPARTGGRFNGPASDVRIAVEYGQDPARG